MKLAVLTPVLDDWSSFGRLLQEISSSFCDPSLALEIVAVDDGSSESFELCNLALSAGVIRSVEILHLGLNLGHQRAIAVGLVDVAYRKDLDGIFVMDCDGEDRPEDLPKLLATGRDYPGHIIVARRTQRSESLSFRIGYAMYKFLFSLLTGHRINFGNFSFMPITCVRRLVFMSEIWNNLPAAILRSRIGYVPIPTVRGKRYVGWSRMNWTSLIAHGLGAMAVYIDIVFLRILFGAVLTAAMAMLGIGITVALRIGTTLAMPGWPTTVVGMLGLLLMQVSVMVLAMLLIVLAGRNGRPIVPIADAGLFIATRQRFELEPMPAKTVNGP
jgi:hypothetical protein